MQYFSANLSLLVTSLKKVTNFLIKDFNELNYLNIGNYTNSTFANKSFKFIENKIIEDLKRIKSEYCFILNDGTIIENKDKSNYIVISNINGFDNFKKGIPYFTISLALIRNNQALAAAVYQPLLDNLFIAEKHKGAYLNKFRLKSKCNNTHKTHYLIATNNPSTLNNKFNNPLYLITNCPTLEICFLSSLKIDLCIYSNALNYFDILPALIIAEEAGYSVTYKREYNSIKNLIIGSVFVRESLKL